MDYSKLSDCEIAHMVSQKLPGRYITYADHVMDSETEETFDPCNNPADAWPIIQENGICIAYDGTCWDASCPLRDIKPVSDWRKHPYNPFRMAMIVFLMMQGDE